MLFAFDLALYFLILGSHQLCYYSYMGLIKLSLYTTRSHLTHVAFAFGIIVLIFNDFPSIPTHRNQPSSNSRLTRSTAIA